MRRRPGRRSCRRAGCGQRLDTVLLQENVGRFLLIAAIATHRRAERRHVHVPKVGARCDRRGRIVLPRGRRHLARLRHEAGLERERRKFGRRVHIITERVGGLIRSRAGSLPERLLDQVGISDRDAWRYPPALRLRLRPRGHLRRVTTCTRECGRTCARPLSPDAVCMRRARDCARSTRPAGGSSGPG